MFLFFSVARSAHTCQAERAILANSDIAAEETDSVEKMPTDKIVDVSPLALRMSSPFNAGYWLTA